MKDREPRKLPLKAATFVSGAVLVVGGGGFAHEGIINISEAREQVEQTHPRPDYQLVMSAKPTILFTESQNTPASSEVRTAAQTIINQDKAFNEALHNNKLYKKSDRKFYGGMAGIIGGMILLAGVALHSEKKGDKKWQSRHAGTGR